MPNEFITKAGFRVLAAHQRLYERTDGAIGHRLLLGTPSLLLRTTGRLTGLSRTNALFYGRDGDVYLVTASNGGLERAPGWLPNVRADSHCEIQVGRRRHKATARVTLPGDPDYARRWEIVNKVTRGGYKLYQKNMRRVIPIVELTPVPSRNQ